MKQKILLLFAFLCLQSQLRAQTFSVQNDTVSLVYSGTTLEGNNGIIVPISGPNVAFKWSVLSTDFPPDWISSHFSFCDNYGCYYIGSLISSSISCITTPYDAGATGFFTYSIDLSTVVTTGIHYITLEMKDILMPTSIATQTYIVKI